MYVCTLTEFVTPPSFSCMTLDSPSQYQPQMGVPNVPDIFVVVVWVWRAVRVVVNLESELFFPYYYLLYSNFD